MNIEPVFWFLIIVIPLIVQSPFILGVAIALGLIRFSCMLIKDHEEREANHYMPWGMYYKGISAFQSKIQCGVGYLILISLAVLAGAVIVFTWGSVI